jgi:hypothetical protein
MRRLMNLIEQMGSQPEWFSHGEIVSIFDPKWDACEFLNGDEYEYEFRLCDVPVELVVAADFAPVDNRSGEIETWAKDEGGYGAALRKRPPLALWTSQQAIKLLDGYHRANLAARSGQVVIPMLIGLGDPDA